MSRVRTEGSIAAALFALAALCAGCKAGGPVRGWGDNKYGQLGDGTYVQRASPVVVKTVNSAIAVAAGDKHSAAIESDGHVFRWGLPASSGWGLTTTSGLNCERPVNLPLTPPPRFDQLIDDVVQLSSGTCHLVALKRDGTVWAWGRNAGGELGNGTINNQGVPRAVSVLTDVTAIDSGGGHSLAIRTDGTVWGWGVNHPPGALGVPPPQLVPFQIPGLADIVGVSTGGRNFTFWETNLALAADGSVWQWNGNPGIPTPLLVPGLTDVVRVEAGHYGAYAIRADGTVWAWDGNPFGPPGVGIVPAPVVGLTDVIDLAAGARHALALTSNGEVRSWGENNVGQLGDGTTTGRATPVPVSGLTAVVADVAAGDYTSFAVLASAYGQLCDFSRNRQWVCGGGPFPPPEILYCPPDAPVVRGGAAPAVNLCPARSTVPLCKAIDCVPCLVERTCPAQRFELRFETKAAGLRAVVIDAQGRVVGRTIEAGTQRRLQFPVRPGSDYRLVVIPGGATPRGVPLSLDKVALAPAPAPGPGGPPRDRN